MILLLLLYVKVTIHFTFQRNYLLLLCTEIDSKNVNTRSVNSDYRNYELFVFGRICA